VNCDSASASIPVLLDTDIGSDIDDALALAYLLGQPRCELLGITTVSGRDPRIRASLADAVCRAQWRSVIHCERDMFGPSRPLADLAGSEPDVFRESSVEFAVSIRKSSSSRLNMSVSLCHFYTYNLTEATLK